MNYLRSCFRSTLVALFLYALLFSFLQNVTQANDTEIDEDSFNTTLESSSEGSVETEDGGSPDCDDDDDDEYEVFARNRFGQQVLSDEFQDFLNNASPGVKQRFNQALEQFNNLSNPADDAIQEINTTYDDASGSPDQIVDLVTGTIKGIVNGDPFIAFETTFTNVSDAPLDVGIRNVVNTLPISLDTDLQYETFLSAEVTDTGGDGDASATVVVSYTRTLSDVTGSNLSNTVTSEQELDFLSNLTDGIPVQETSGPTALSISNIDLQLLADAGVLDENRGTIAIAANLEVIDLSPGDTLTVSYAYSVGNDDGSIPFFPAEALVLAVDQDLFFVIPEPSSLLLAGLCVVITAAPLRKLNRRI